MDVGIFAGVLHIYPYQSALLVKVQDHTQYCSFYRRSPRGIEELIPVKPFDTSG
jgi:hypothetical protein